MKGEALKLKILNAIFKHGGGSVIVWNCMTESWRISTKLGKVYVRFIFREWNGINYTAWIIKNFTKENKIKKVVLSFAVPLQLYYPFLENREMIVVIKRICDRQIIIINFTMFLFACSKLNIILKSYDPFRPAEFVNFYIISKCT